MRFEDLPTNWPNLPLTDPDHISGVLDLMVSLEARCIGALLILVCDEERRPLQPIQIDHMPACPPDDAVAMLMPIATEIARRPGMGVLVAIARPGRLMATPNDRAWRRTIASAFNGRAEVLGVHVVTPDGSTLVRTRREAA